MRSVLGREIRKNFGSFSERPNARRNDNPLAADYSAIGEGEFEARTIAANLSDTSLLQIAAHIFLKPLPISNKGLPRNALDRLGSTGGLVSFERKCGTWIGNRGRLSWRSEEHARRHAIGPEIHWFTEDCGFHTRRTQVRG